MLFKFRNIFLVGMVFFLTACGGTFTMKPLAKSISSDSSTKYYLDAVVDRTGGKFDSANRGAFINTIHDGLAQAGMITSRKENATHVVKITVTTYNRRNGAARFFLGAFSGSDKFSAVIELVDKSGNKVSTGNLENSDASILGSADDMVRSSGIKIVEYLTGKEKVDNTEDA